MIGKFMKEEEKKLYLFYMQKMGVSPSMPKSKRIKAEELFENFDAFFFDAFGTLYNRNGFVYPGAREFISKLRGIGKEIRLLTNAAHEEQELSEELRNMGFPIAPSEIYSSGKFLSEVVETYSFKNAYFLGRDSGRILLERSGIEIRENPDSPVVVICSTEISTKKIERAAEILKSRESLLVVLNPDACAPEVDGSRSDVSGLQAFRLQQQTNCKTEWKGKPFSDVFYQALKSISPKSRVVMIGDTLGTDVVGAKKVGISSCLVMGRNMREETFAEDCESLKVTPDFIIEGFA